MVSFPYHSHKNPQRYGNSMGSAYHKGVPCPWGSRGVITLERMLATSPPRTWMMVVECSTHLPSPLNRKEASRMGLFIHHFSKKGPMKWPVRSFERKPLLKLYKSNIIKYQMYTQRPTHKCTQKCLFQSIMFSFHVDAIIISWNSRLKTWGFRDLKCCRISSNQL